MKKIITTFLIITVILVSCQEKQKKADADYVNLKGEPIYLDDYKGKKLLVNFWATWCTPCLQEMPSLVKAQEILKNEYVFLFPSTDDIDKIATFSKSKNYPLEFLHYKYSLDQKNVYALPATFIYNETGEIVKRIDGATEWDSDETIKLLKSIK